MQFPSSLELAMYMWLIVVCRTSDYWLGTPPHVTLMVLVEVEVMFVSLSWGTRCVPRGSRGLILGSTGMGRPLLYPASVFPTYTVAYMSTVMRYLDLRVFKNNQHPLSINIGHRNRRPPHWKVFYCYHGPIGHVCVSRDDTQMDPYVLPTPSSR